VTTLSNISERWLNWVMAAAWQVSLLVCVLTLIGLALRGASARLRYGLWLLVLVKALLPPSVAAEWAIGRWAGSALESWKPTAPRRIAEPGEQGGANLSSPDVPLMVERGGAANDASRYEMLFLIWLAGCLAMWIAVAARYVRLARSTGAMRPIEEGPVRIELERIAQRLGVRRAPVELYATPDATSPLLFGLWRPRIIIPESIVDGFSPAELRMILTHELMHWRRRDVWVGWVQVLVQGLYWFHPFVWAANARIRHERECACDEAVLRTMPDQRDDYGQTLVRVLTAARGRSLAMDHLAGVFERGSRLQLRLEEIMSFDPNRRRFGWLSRAAVLGAAVLLLPMAAPAQEGAAASDAAAASGEGSGAPSAVQRTADANNQRSAPETKTSWPTIAASVPNVGATDVDPALNEIRVTFDRDMDAGGFSWTGGGPAFPPSPEGAQPYWKDKRTCVLPVELKRGAFYRVGINSSSHQNFRSAAGEPAETMAIYFATRGASRSVASRARAPQAVRIAPERDAADVDPRLGVISVTFDMPMDPNGFSFTGGGPTYPKVPDGQRPRWSRDGKTCTLPVELAPGTTYELGLNSVRHKNFASRWGVPLAPVQLRFTTAGDRVESAEVAADVGGPPRIVKMIPENGATDVDPAMTEIVVSFDRPMGEGFSWTGGGENFPTISAGARPRWSSDKQTCTLPVQLKPEWTYRLGLNSASHKNFTSADGTPLEPVIYEFRTDSGGN
jgi:beta-lactamase regulating signal transducer with metallopeptidase domain